MVVLLASPMRTMAATADAAQSTAEVTADISLLWSIPFVCLLACIALMPFVAKHWWEHHYPKVAIALAAISAAYYWLLVRDPWPWLHEMQEYVSFILLLGALYIVSGGIVIQVGRKATPMANCILLLVGAVIANIFGTTGAAMLLIRPYLRMNRGHIKPYHIIFFIFIVANVGGAVTPIGDPPLFLGYLYGVPFWWVLEHCLWIWVFAVVALLVIFFIIDTLDHGKAERHHPGDPGPTVRITGIQNFLFVGLIIFGVFQTGIFDTIHRIHEEGWSLALAGNLIFSREILMALAAVGSRLFTAAKIYLHNEFNYGPIREVAILFIGIFSTMVPALQWLGVHANQMPLKTPGQYYFLSGSLSSVLDNAAGCPQCPVGDGALSPTGCAEKQRQPQRVADRFFNRRPAAEFVSCGGLDGRGLFRSLHLHRQRAELHGQIDCRVGRHTDTRIHTIRSGLHAADFDTAICCGMADIFPVGGAVGAR
jgi:Na+/H+ antiporter NhaD/arsenite permease-like protein